MIALIRLYSTNFLRSSFIVLVSITAITVRRHPCCFSRTHYAGSEFLFKSNTLLISWALVLIKHIIQSLRSCFSRTHYSDSELLLQPNTLFRFWALVSVEHIIQMLSSCFSRTRYSDSDLLFLFFKSGWLKAAYTNFIVFALTRPEIEPSGESSTLEANALTHYTTEIFVWHFSYIWQSWLV
jgi:hypothetical protein